MDISRRLRPALLAAVLAGTLVATSATAAPASPLSPTPSAGSGPSAPPASSSAFSPATSAAGPCHVVGVSRTGRAWLPAADLVVPGGRVASARVLVGTARVEVVDGLVHVQRTSRRSPAAGVPVRLEVALVAGDGTVTTTCTVDPGRTAVDGSTRLRRVVRAG